MTITCTFIDPVADADDDDLHAGGLGSLRLFDGALAVERAVVDDQQRHLHAVGPSATLAVSACSKQSASDVTCADVIAATGTAATTCVVILQ